MTALFDGVNRAIEIIAPQLKEDDAALVIVITDGEENNSSQINKEFVPRKIKELEGDGTGQWTFTYMGTTKDLARIAKETGMSVSNSAHFESKTSGGWKSGTEVARGGIRRFMNSRSAGAKHVKGLYTPKE